MDWRVGYGLEGSGATVGANVGANVGSAPDAATVAQVGADTVAHAVAPGSPVAACGVPARQAGSASWPPGDATGCPRCTEITATFSS